MKAIIRHVILCGLLVSSLAAQRFVHTEGKYLVDGRGHKLTMHGTNLGNWLVPEGYMFHFEGGPQSAREIEALTIELIGPTKAAEFWRQWRDQYVAKEDIDFLKSIGVNTLRVPIHYKLFANGNKEGFALLDRVVQWSREAGIYVIVDLHCAPGGQTGANIDDSYGYPWLFEDAQAQEQLIALWTDIAKHYRNEPAVLGYDLLNEPIPTYPQLEKYNSALEPLFRRVVAAIRSVDRNHVVILTGAQWDSNFKVLGAPFDKNAMYTFHKYWTPPTQEVIQQYLDFRDKYNVPLYMGESGENTDEWISEFAEVLNRNEIGWTFWPYKKMDATSSIVSFARPQNWDKITAFAKLPQGTGNSEKLVAARPSIAEAQQAYSDLLKKIQFQECRKNLGYIKALGMKASGSE